jgi:polar amino acid transport system substrate-binding protein
MKIIGLLLTRIFFVYSPIVCVFTTALTTALLSTPCFSQEVVRLYTIEEVDKKGRSIPLQKETANLLVVIEESLALKFDLRRVPWKRAMDNALQGDGILLGMSITKERAKNFAFSDPVNASRNWLITRCDSQFPFNTLSDLKGKTLGVVLGTSAGEEFDAQANILFKIENDTGAGISRLEKLFAKRMDALVWYGSISKIKEMEVVINRTFRENNRTLKSDDRLFCVLPKPISVVSNHFAIKINTDKNALMARINQAMAKARKEGRLPPATFSE